MSNVDRAEWRRRANQFENGSAVGRNVGPRHPRTFGALLGRCHFDGNGAGVAVLDAVHQKGAVTVGSAPALRSGSAARGTPRNALMGVAVTRRAQNEQTDKAIPNPICRSQGSVA
jgi:hypothetical protein